MSDLRKLLAAATERPWIVKRADGFSGEYCNGVSRDHNHSAQTDCYDADDCPVVTEEIVTTDSGHYGPKLPDADLIVAAVNALPRLLDRIDVLEKALAACDRPHSESCEALNSPRLSPASDCDCGAEEHNEAIHKVLMAKL